MMSASMGGMLWRPEISAAAYPSPLDLVRDLVALQIGEIEGLIDQGVRWIQLDSLGYNQVFDEQFRAATGLGGVPPEAILDATVTADAELVRAAKRKDPGVTVGMHICRGNNRSAWMASGSYEPVADLALSPQCGFASTAGGNQLTVDDERRKLELVVGTASKVWG
jgi:5-methyltetrahydropteroyltriglutamate--homocysteine methyltransferase